MQIRKRAILGIFAATTLLSPLALGCSGDDSDDAGTPAVTEPLLTRVVEGETTPALEPAGGATSTATLEPAAPTPTDTPEVIVVQPGDSQPPGTRASAGGVTVEMGIGTYCWGTLCVDKIGPITRGTLTIAPGEEISVAFPEGAPGLRSVSVSAYPAGESQAVGDVETAWTPPAGGSQELPYASEGSELLIDGALEPGTYVLLVGMFFEAGDVQYAVVLEVE